LSRFEINFLEEYSPESIIEEVRRIEKITKTGTITQQDIKKYGRISISTIYKYFDRLADVAERAGLKPNCRLGNTSKEDIVKELERISKIIDNKRIMRAHIDQYSNISYWKIIKHFKSLGMAVRTAGLVPRKSTKHNRDDLLTILIDLWNKTIEKEGRRPYITDLKKFKFGISPDTFRRTFGSWKKALKKAYDYVNEKNIIEEVPSDTQSKTIKSLHSKNKLNEQIKPSQFLERKPISIRKRFFVFKRDHFSCVLCGSSGMGVKLELDHRVPISKGGSDDLDNLQTLCYECNRGKRDSIEE
jgi:hypothetical protein